jgi:hypothetical protein
MVTRGCTTLPGWVAAKRAHAVQVRASSGGVVPNGPGGLNLSLTWRGEGSSGATPNATDAISAARWPSRWLG